MAQIDQENTFKAFASPKAFIKGILYINIVKKMLTISKVQISNLNGLPNLFLDQDFSDVTLVCADNKQLQCHRAVLAASSSFLRDLLSTTTQQNTFLYLGRVKEGELLSLLEYIYLGKCSVEKKNLASFLELAEELGLSKQELHEGEITQEEKIKIEITENSFQPKRYALKELVVGMKDNKEAICAVPTKKQWFSKFDNPKRLKQIRTSPKEIDNEQYLPEDKMVAECQAQLGESMHLPMEPGGIKKGLKTKKRDSGSINSWGSIKIPSPDRHGNILCEECSKFFTTIEKYKTHRLVHHELAHIVIPTHDKEGKIICVDCDPMLLREFNGVYKYRRHRWEEHEGKIFACIHCDSNFFTKRLLNQHNLLHSGGFVSCDYCERRFKSEELLTKHRAKAIIQCDNCEFRACTLLAVRWHLRTVHNPLYYEELFNCDRCRYKTPVFKQIMHHITVTHGTPKFECDQCDFKGKKSASIVEHKQSKHENVIFKCDQCEYQAPFLRHLKHHKSTKHEGLVRLFCGEFKKSRYNRECKFSTLSEEVMIKHKEIEKQKVDKQKSRIANYHRKN